MRGDNLFDRHFFPGKRGSGEMERIPNSGIFAQL